MTGDSSDRRNRLLEHASEMRSKAQETMATVASAALALSVAFRGPLTDSAPDGVWLLRLSWIGLTVCVISVIAERVVSAMRMTVHAVGETFPSKTEKWWMGAPYVLSMIAFLVGIVALAAFGWVSL
jgi:hypothetical protein